MDTDLTAANGKKVKALEIFAYALQYFKEQALKVKPRGSQPYVRPTLGCCTCPGGRGAAYGESMWALRLQQSSMFLC
jgi:hypothetical protein